MARNGGRSEVTLREQSVSIASHFAREILKFNRVNTLSRAATGYFQISEAKLQPSRSQFTILANTSLLPWHAPLRFLNRTRRGGWKSLRIYTPWKSYCILTRYVFSSHFALNSIILFRRHLTNTRVPKIREWCGGRLLPYELVSLSAGIRKKPSVARNRAKYFSSPNSRQCGKGYCPSGKNDVTAM